MSMVQSLCSGNEFLPMQLCADVRSGISHVITRFVLEVGDVLLRRCPSVSRVRLGASVRVLRVVRVVRVTSVILVSMGPDR